VSDGRPWVGRLALKVRHVSLVQGGGRRGRQGTADNGEGRPGEAGGWGLADRRGHHE